MPLSFPRWPPDWPELAAAVGEAVRSGDWGRYRSQQRDRLAAELAKQFQTTHVRLCCSGSAAIEIALRASGLASGDEVIVAAYDYPGNVRAIELAGGRPVLVDSSETSTGMQLQQVEAAASDRVRAVIASHLFGVAADLVPLREICDHRGWILIEDACQVPGMTIGGGNGSETAKVRPEIAAGSIGHFGTLSFGGSKPLTAGSGGALLTSERRLAARLGPLLDRPSDVIPLAPLAAAVLLPQLERLESLNQQRKATVEFLEDEINDRLPGWTWMCQAQSNVSPAYYKVAWLATDPDHRQRIVAAAGRLGLPIGEGFRSLAASSERRFRKPVELVNAERYGQRLFVLDHTALMLEPRQHEQLGELLIKLHAETS